eukprot:358864-Chlamydomonas_euryale.AAC.4
MRTLAGGKAMPQRQYGIHADLTPCHTCAHALYSLLFTLAFPDAIISISSFAKSQSLQRALLTRPGPGLTALQHSSATGSHTQKGCTTSATPPL